MVTEELVRDKYIKTQQVGMFVEKFDISPRYIGTVSDILSDRVRRLLAERQVGYVASQPGSANPTIIGEEEEVPVYTTFNGAANSIHFGHKELIPQTEPSAHVVWLEESYAILWLGTKDEVEVYPGYRVSSEEYERRFKGVALDHFRKVLSPELFKAYVHTMGSIEGWGIRPKDRYKGKD